MSQVLQQLTIKSQFVQALRLASEDEHLTDGRMSDGHKLCAMAVFHKIHGDHAFNAPVGGNSILGVPIVVYNHIAELNDSGLSFIELADYIERAGTDDLSGLTY